MRMRILIGLLLVLIPSTVGHGDIGRFINPFEGLAAVRLSVIIGGPLDLGGGAALELFAGDQERAARFRRVVSDAVISKLRSCGISIDEQRDDEIAVRFFGRPERLTDCYHHYVYMVEVDIYNVKLAGDGNSAFFPLPPVIGTAADRALEEVLIDTAVAILGSELGNCVAAESPEAHK